MLSGFVFLLAAAAQAPAKSPAPARWVVDWSPERCSLVRETGGKSPSTLMIRTIPGTGWTELWFFDPRWAGPTTLFYDPVDLGLTPSGYRVSKPAISAKLRGQNGMTVTSLDEDFLQKLSVTASLSIERRGRTLAQVQLPNSARAVATLGQCEDAVMRNWGFDPAVLRSLSRPARAIGGLTEWFSDRDYPAEAVRLGHKGSVLTRLVIDTQGGVAQCVLVEVSGHDSLDRRTCQVLVRRGRFQPALTAAGEPTRGLMAVRIKWSKP